MDNRAIGIFDSGLGGLTAVKEMLRLLPNEDLIYFGDTGRVPYGTRGVEIIEKYARQDINFLLSKNVKLIVAACGTVSSILLPKIKEDYPVKIIGVVKSAARAAVEQSKNKKIGVIGTSATVKSGVYEKTVKEIDGSFEVYSEACPLFVPLVENGFIENDNKITQLTAEKYLADLKEKDIGSLILGCTHFPLIKEIIARYVNNIPLIDSGREVVKTVKKTLASQNIETDRKTEGYRRFYVSDCVEDFYKMSEMIFNRSDFTNIERISVDSF